MGIGNGVGGMIENIRQYIIKHNLDRPEFYYILGTLFGDAFFTKFDNEGYPHEIRINTVDEKLAKKFIKAVESLEGRYTYHIYSQHEKALGKKPIHRVCVYGFRNLGVYIKDLYKMVYLPLYNNPYLLLELLDSKEKIVSFIKGLYECEGCFYIGGNKTPKWQIQFTSSNYELLIVVKELLKRLGFEFHISKPYKSRISTKPFWQLRMSGRLTNTERMQRFFELIRPVIKNPEDYLLRKRKKGEIKI